ncbi:maleylpyruvate isomerase family mycothiol-dependent enzyme [Phytohabitans suffuscus]|uniref:Maleylpyruvate isomerase n=1 Tax=Phytohabitans suffuscus TaxID=624315 RepID=A0A6F8YBI5_9ACTN|nr:maleylpyruvate isomerase family mycothiol-dependent enzyme [Phytohabitans suffuscus]BCB83456.1 maleylpyruvate isomerase [Phytohabitans suffuscus]
MTADPLVLLPELDRATDRLLRTAAALDGAAVAGPSLLPGWTRGHVLTHLARNADSYLNLLTWARTGVRTPGYPSAEAREAGIRDGAARPLAEQLEDLRAASARLAGAAAEMPADAWGALVERTGGRKAPAATCVWGRLREVEVHHVDLDAGYKAGDWPDAFSQHLLREVVSDLSSASGVTPLVLRPTELEHDLTIGQVEQDTPVVAGPAYELAAWLAGRSSGVDLDAAPEGPLPTPPAWI